MINLIIYRPSIVKYFKDRTELAKSTLVSIKVVLSLVSPRAAAGLKLIRLTSLTIGQNEALYSLIFGNFHVFR